MWTFLLLVAGLLVLLAYVTATVVRDIESRMDRFEAEMVTSQCRDAEWHAMMIRHIAALEKTVATEGVAHVHAHD